MKKVLISLSLAAAVFAGSATATEYNYEITPTIGGVMPEGNSDIQDSLYYGLKFGINLQDAWIDQVELGFEYSPSVDIDYTGGKDTDFYRGSVNLVKELPMTKYFSFYGLAGVGFEALDDNWRANNDRMFVDYGAGLKYRLTEQLALKAEVRHEFKINNEHHEPTNYLLYSLGLSYAFGEVAAQPEPAPEVVVEKPVVEEKVIGDDDNDGVLNNIDECPNTPAGVPVDEKGCAKTISLHVKFNFDKSNILPQYDGEINKVADFMTKYPVYKVMLEGYTDSIGTEAYNLKLSDRRSASVAKALTDKGVSAEKISTAGYGESNPIASNKTKEGRAENRRVDAVFSY